jgi:excisionase family DNA binding protein
MLSDEQQNTTGGHAIEQESCGLCEDLLANLQRFFVILENARKPPSSEWMTVEEVARELKVSKSIVYRIIRNGELSAVNIVDGNGRIARKGHYRVRRSSLDEYLTAKQVKSPQNQTAESRPRRYPRVKNHLGL